MALVGSQLLIHRSDNKCLSRLLWRHLAFHRQTTAPSGIRADVAVRTDHVPAQYLKSLKRTAYFFLDATAKLEKEWAAMNIKVPLCVLKSPYRDIGYPLVKYIKNHRAQNGSEVITVYTPIYVVGHWWETILHNHKARRIRQKLMLVHGVTLALVPWLLDSSEVVYGRRSRPIPGQDRRGEPMRPQRQQRPIPRKPLKPASDAEIKAAGDLANAERPAEPELLVQQPGAKTATRPRNPNTPPKSSSKRSKK